MLDYVLWAFLIIGVIAGGIIVAQRPSFWFGLSVVAVKAALPYLIPIFKPHVFTEEEKSKMREGWTYEEIKRGRRKESGR